MKGLIFDTKKYAIHDGPGIRTTVFFKGCPLSCRWCHNPEGLTSARQGVYRKDLCIGCGQCVEVCPQGALSLTPEGVVTDPTLCIRCGTCAERCPAEAREWIGREVTPEEVLAEIEKDRAFYDESGGGVTFSGGEPLMQPDFLLALLGACGKIDIHRTVDTTGHADPALLLRVAGETDLFLYDLKLMSPEKHRMYTGITNHLILENLEALSRHGAKIRVRAPMIPGINMDDENIDAMGSFVSRLPSIPEIHLLPFHNAARDKYRKLGLTYELEGLIPPTDDHMASVAERLRHFGLTVQTGGSKA